jgi:hypothetical protein
VQGNVLQPQPWPESKLLVGGLHGTLFVNPYDQTQIYVLTTDGVRYSTDGGLSFQPDTLLTKLITASGKYMPTTGFSGGNTGFSGGNSDVDIANSYFSLTMATLSDLSWNRTKPAEMAAVSPFTGLFYSSGNGQWKDLTSSLPSPHTPISAVTINDNSIFIALEGRGVLEIRDFR